jgi:zinc transport system permease protein
MTFFTDMSTNPFLLTGLLAGIGASLACGVIGPYVITRRIVFLVGAIAHMAVGGVGAAIFLNTTWPATFGWLEPIYGAVLVALGAAVLIAYLHDRAAERLDTLIGAMWAIGMSIGILLIKFTSGYHADFMSYLFGNITYVPWMRVAVIGALDVVILLVALAWHKRLLAVCLDAEQAQLQGVSVLRTNIVLLVLVALAVTSLIQVVGLILVLALLTLPAATAAHHTTRMAGMMALATLLAIVLTTVPRIGVYGTAVSPESAIVLAAGAVYLVSVIATRLRIKRR